MVNHFNLEPYTHAQCTCMYIYSLFHNSLLILIPVGHERQDEYAKQVKQARDLGMRIGKASKQVVWDGGQPLFAKKVVVSY